MKATVDSRTFCITLGLNEQGKIFKLRQDIYAQTPKGKNHTTLFLFTLKLHDGIFPKKPDLTPKIPNTMIDRFYNQKVRLCQIKSINYIQIK